MKRRAHALACFLALIIALPLGAQSPTAQTPATNADDRGFLQDAAADGLAEVAMANDALHHAQAAPTKQFAQRMVTDHTRLNHALADVANRKHVELPASGKQHALASAEAWRTQLHGGAYDRAYAQAMVQGHSKAVALFTKGAGSRDPDVRKFAQDALPMLKQHLAMATDLSHSKALPGQPRPMQDTGEQ